VTTGRPMNLRLRLRGWLHVRTPLHVGGIALDPAEALPVALDGRDRPYVPGTSLAGALRAWMRGADTRPEALEDLWGFVPDGQSDAGRASRVVVHDALITTSTGLAADGTPADLIDPLTLPSREGVGIDRRTGAAASEILHSRTIIPAGSYLRLELDMESTTGEIARDRARLRALRDALASGRIALGASTSGGLGVVRLVGETISEQDLTTPQGLLAVLRGESSVTDLTGAGDANLPSRRESLEVEITWRPLAPVMVRASGDGPVIGTLPLAGKYEDGAYVLNLPGRSIKGALRSHAEFIERTARGVCAPGHAYEDTSARAHSDAFRAQLDQLPSIKALFGTANRSAADDDFAWGHGALTAHECVTTTRIPAEPWEALADGLKNDDRTPFPAEAREQLARAGLDQADHVAIDRWTGGAADERLYSVLEPHGVEWEPIRLSVDLTRLGERRYTCVALLLLVLRDLKHGRIPLGGMVTRGFGDIEVESIVLTGDEWGDGATLDEVLEGDYVELLDQEWHMYLEGVQV
jgi:CRISPR/Cas system CSM-associated protein Csm3 (group 7 of RAMP superfamily)